MTNDWFTYLLVICFLLLALAKYLYPHRFSDFMALPINNNFFRVYGKEDSVRHPFNIILFVVQILCAGAFISLLLRSFSNSFTIDPLLLLQICTVYTIFVMGKYFIEKIVANIFSIDGIIDMYLYRKLGYRNFLAMILFLGVLIFIYVVPDYDQAVWIFALTILILNAFTLLYIYKKNSTLITSNFFYFILYLCALEISPYIIFYKLFMTQTGF